MEKSSELATMKKAPIIGRTTRFGARMFEPRMMSLYLILSGFCSVILPCPGQNYSGSYTNLALYLSNRAWLQEMEIDLSKNRYRPAHYPPERFQGFTTWRASLQPGGFFFQCRSNSPFDPMLMYGESSNSFWQTSSRGISTAPKKPEDGGSEKNGRQVMCLHFKRMLVDALNLGIEGLDNQHITWISPDEFTSPLLDWIGKPTAGTIHVTVESHSQGLPTRLRCETTTDKGKRVVTVLCRYDKPSLPPTQTEYEMIAADNKPRQLTNIVRSITFGLREDALRGFLPSDLLPRDFDAKVQMVGSNGSRYLVMTNGTRQLVDEKADRAAVRVLTGRPIRRFLVYVFFGLSVLVPPVAIFVYWVVNRRRRKGCILSETTQTR